MNFFLKKIKPFARKRLRSLHDSIPSLMSKWKVEEALKAAEQKLELMLTIDDQLATVIPSAFMEVYEMRRLAEVKISSFSNDYISFSVNGSFNQE